MAGDDEGSVLMVRGDDDVWIQFCPHTSEQNGFVERRNHHAVETGLTLLTQARVPQRFWHYAFDTAVYLINRMPSRTSTNKSPFDPSSQCSPISSPSAVSHLSPTSKTSPESSNSQPSPISITSIPTPPPPITRKRPTNLHQNPKQQVPYNASANHAIVLPTTITEPTSFTIANNTPEWVHAMKEEYDALMKNETRFLVPRASNTNVVDGKWVYRLKRDKNGAITRNKARFVTKGFR
nr:retrotransposon protein, putative, Ty1-copia subclass [Tanacetum cinerariifolium]